MNEKSDYQTNRQKLGEFLKNEPARTPIQEVRPIEPSGPLAPTPVVTDASSPPAKKDAHVNFWVSDELMERLKIHAVK